MLLDTNIVSYFFRRDSRAALYEHHLVGQTRYIAFVTLGELYQWMFLRPFSETSRSKLLAYIAQLVVVAYDDQLIWTWAELSANCRRSGVTMSFEDSWIAATALRHALPLVTHNPKHFRHVEGLTIISESRNA